MGKVIAGMTVSLDGYVSPEDLFSDFPQWMASDNFKGSVERTGAVIMGRNAYDMADPFEWVNDGYEYQVPLFILTHNPPEKFPEGNGKLTVNFATDVESLITRAKEAAGEKDVTIIGGVSTIQQCINSGMVDELQMDYMPVILNGKGTSLLGGVDADKITLERAKVEETTSARTSITFNVSKTS